MSVEGFDLGELVAQSGHTAVRRAVRKSDGARVVIKTLVNEYPTRHELEQLESEYRILRRLDGVPHIVRAHSLERDRDRPLVVMEDFGGEVLTGSETATSLSFERFFVVARAVTTALEAIHARDIVHRDVKPSNVVVNWATGDVKMVDFDAALDLSRPRRQAKDVFEGSLPYMSPEQTGRMNRELDYRADYYSLGVTFFELLTGTLPFTAHDNMGWVHCHISRVAPDAAVVNPAIPESLARIVRKLMDKNPDDRYQSARGLQYDLDRAERQYLGSSNEHGFALGSRDLSLRFQVSPRLFGREVEIEAMLAAFAATRRGPTELVLLTGGGGAGKSATVREVERQILSAQGRFLSARLDEQDRALPYAAFVQLLRGMAKQLLMETDERLAEWRRALNGAIVPSGQVLLDLVPELEQVIGRQAPIPVLGPEEAHARFRAVVQAFIGAVARSGEPLVLFFDDLQSADPSTLDLLRTLAVAGELGNLMIIAAFRAGDDAASGDDPSAAIPPSLKELARGRARTITLGPLSERSVSDLVMATTRAETQPGAYLARIVHEKTGGNPFFIHEFLNTLAREGAFRLNAPEGRWEWDADRIAGAAASDNVVDLVVRRLRALQPGTANVLGRAACIGQSFHAKTLAALTEDLPVAEALHDAVAQGMLLPEHLSGPSEPAEPAGAASAAEGPAYRFQHARLHHAAYSLLPEDERRRMHLRLGRHLLALGPSATADDNIFEVVGHFNRGRSLVTERQEQDLLVELNVAAAARAKRSTAYALAAGHLEIAREVSSSLVAGDAPLTAARFQMALTHAECLFLAGELERANTLAAQLAPAAPDAMSGAAAQFLVARTFDYNGRYGEEIEVIRQALARLGIELPRDHAEIDRRIGEGIGKMQAYLAQHPVEELAALPEMVDAEKIMAMNLLFQLVPPAIQTYPPLFVLAELIMFELGTTYGVCVASAKNFVDCGIIQGGALGDYETAHRLGKVAFELVKRYAPAPVEAGINFVFANFVSHWRAPFRESLEAFKRAKKIGRELGNVGHTAYAYALETQRLFLAGTSLDGCAAAVVDANAYLRQVGARGTLPAVATVAQAVGRLRGAPVEAGTSLLTEDESLAQMRASGNGPFMFAHSQAEAMVSYLLGDLAAAARWDAVATSLLRAAVGILSVADHHLFQGLILCRRWPTLSAEEQTAAQAVLDQNLAKLANWAKQCPENFAPKHRLLQAAVGRRRGAALDEVLKAFDEAVTTAGPDSPHLRALANELQADLWLERGSRKLARALMQEAHYLYGVWGARAKEAQMEAAHPEWFAGAASVPDATPSDTIRRSTVSVGALDLASAMKATRAISGEVTRERLYARLMATMLENAGAQRGCLMVVAENGAIEVVWRATAEDHGQDRFQATSLEASGDVCVEMVRFVARTGETVTLDDALHHPTYGNDPYFRRSGARSVLCLPVLHQGKILAILCVENSAVTHAFAPDRQQLLQLIASQAAVSITNARLYDSLEEKVAARTRELAARNVDLERAHQALTNEMKTRQAVEIELRQAQKLEAVGRLASGVAHEINTPVQFVTDSVQFLKDATTDLLGFLDKLREVRRLVLAGEPATDAAGVSAEVEEELDLSYLIENMPSAFERSLEGLDRVATIVRSMKEFAHPDAKQMVAVDLNRAIESTLTMARNEYKYVADVEVDFAELPMVLCHAGEVNQAILNIVVNAAHAIGDVVKGSDGRGRISLRTRREGERVLVEIEDTGGGIPEAIRERIFDPFFTTKEVGKGTGQGLAIARSVIVDKHGGELTCRSEVGKGTTFSIRLPVEGKRDAASSSKAA